MSFSRLLRAASILADIVETPETHSTDAQVARAARDFFPPVVPDIDDLLDDVRDPAFDDDRLKVLMSAVPHRRFNMDQVCSLLEAFTFDDARLKAARLLRPRVVDPAGWHRVGREFTFSSDGQEAVALLI
jgi:hypothetical protein